MFSSRHRSNRQWLSGQWGSAAITWPLLCLSLLILLGLDTAPVERTIVHITGLVLFWCGYLFILYFRSPWHRSRLTVALWLVVLVQGGVAVTQFALQREIGLAYLGEFSLNPHTPGISVLWNSSGQPWLRAYGLTAHPNFLGAMLAVLLLFLLIEGQYRRWRQGALFVGFTLGFAVGMLGLLVTFTRTGWLAFAGGVIVLAMRREHGSASQQSLQRWRAAWLPLLIVPIFLLVYHDLILNRWIALDTLIEARSIQERLRDAQVALQLIAAHPWLGVGAGNALEAAQQVRAGAGAVHNVPLLVMVELGLLGGLCWLLFMLLPLLPARWQPLRRLPRAATSRAPAADHPDSNAYGTLWMGLLIAGLFDTPLWLTTSWRAALLLGILAALQAQSHDDCARENEKMAGEKEAGEKVVANKGAEDANWL
jgi:O-antigen ligase